MSATSSGFEMNEQSNEGEFNDRSEAVRRAGAGAVAWRAALDAQQSAVPHNTDFYGLTRDLISTLAPVGELIRLMGRQVAGYADGLPSGESVYDDTRQDDPRELLTQAAEVLTDLAPKVSWAALEMHRFWSLIGRIGVEEARAEQARNETGEGAP